MSALDRLNLSGRSFEDWLTGLAITVAALSEAPCKEDEVQLDEIRRLGT